MKIKILKQTVAGKKTVRVGDVIEASDRDAALLISMKKAVKADEAALEKEPEYADHKQGARGKRKSEKED